MTEKGFNVNDEFQASAIRYLTGIRYYKFTNNEGNTVYTFPRYKIVFEAYTTIKNFKKEHNV